VLSNSAIVSRMAKSACITDNRSCPVLSGSSNGGKQRQALGSATGNAEESHRRRRVFEATRERISLDMLSSGQPFKVTCMTAPMATKAHQPKGRQRFGGLAAKAEPNTSVTGKPQ